MSLAKAIKIFWVLLIVGIPLSVLLVGLLEWLGVVMAVGYFLIVGLFSFYLAFVACKAAIDHWYYKKPWSDNENFYVVIFTTILTLIAGYYVLYFGLDAAGIVSYIE